MADKRNAKYVVDYDKPSPKPPEFRLPADPAYLKNVVRVGGDTVPGAEFSNQAQWIMPGSRKEIRLMESHTHPYGVMLGFFGFDYDDIQDLGAEIEFTVDNETHTITKSFASFVPAGVQHGPLILRNVQRPIFHFTAAGTASYE